MGNKSGAQRFTDAEKKILLQAVKTIIPIGSNEWEAVQTEYMRLLTLQRGGRAVARDVKFLKSLFARLRGSRPSTSTPFRPELNDMAREIDELVEQKTAEAELGDINNQDGLLDSSDDEAEVMEVNSFQTLEEQAVENAAADDVQASIPRSAPRTAPMPRKTRAAQSNGLQELTETFAQYMSAAISAMEGPSGEGCSSSAVDASVNEDRLVALL